VKEELLARENQNERDIQQKEVRAGLRIARDDVLYADAPLKEEDQAVVEAEVPALDSVDVSKFDDSDIEVNINAGSDDSDSDDDSDSEDEEAELLRELAKVKAEREAERQRAAAEEAGIAQRGQEEDAVLSNPLLREELGAGAGPVKRRWDDDTVFKNQARDTREVKKRFINDTLRSDFHKAFLRKYMR
jgi:protein CWC15